MRERARDKGRLEDIVEYSNNVAMLIEGFTYEALIGDKRTYYSVMKNVEIVGEAAYMLTKAFKDAHPEIPWKIIQGMRHVLVHDYANVIPRILWGTATHDIPELRQQVEHYLAETDWDAWDTANDSLANVSDTDTNDNIVSVAQKMKAKGYPIEDIADITGLSSEVIKKL